MVRMSKARSLMMTGWGVLEFWLVVSAIGVVGVLRKGLVLISVKLFALKYSLKCRSFIITTRQRNFLALIASLKAKSELPS